jgi:diguanylate cyclase (GGDEF)-like protein
MLTSELRGERLRRILLIADSEADRRWLRGRLVSECVTVVEAVDGPSGLRACYDDPPDLVLLDLELPVLNGFEVLRRLQEDGRTRHVPVIVVSTATDTAEKARGLDLGAVDYVTRPYDLTELQARIRVALRTKRLTELLEQRAHVEGLTGLANRLALEERLAAEWALHRRHGGSLAVWVADLDHFKRVNDAFGHAAGDAVLRQAAAGLRSSIRATDLAARLGGEEFLVIAPRCKLAGAIKTAERFRDRLCASPVVIGRGAVARVTISVGVASSPEDPVGSAAELLARADAALYRAKALGRNRVLGRVGRAGIDPEPVGHATRPARRHRALYPAVSVAGEAPCPCQPRRSSRWISDALP